MNQTYDEYVEQFGEENAKFLMETMGDWESNYEKYTYIDTNIGDFNHFVQPSNSIKPTYDDEIIGSNNKKA